MEVSRLDLRIDELVLNGFKSVDHRRLGEALEGELTRLVRERGLPQGARHRHQADSVDGGTVTLRPEATAEAIGVAIARAVYGGLSR
jgi:hypothetical protein